MKKLVSLYPAFRDPGFTRSPGAIPVPRQTQLLTTPVLPGSPASADECITSRVLLSLKHPPIMFGPPCIVPSVGLSRAERLS